MKAVLRKNNKKKNLGFREREGKIKTKRVPEEREEQVFELEEIMENDEKRQIPT